MVSSPARPHPFPHFLTRVKIPRPLDPDGHVFLQPPTCRAKQAGPGGTQGTPAVSRAGPLGGRQDPQV